jgi:hypothetical protein
MIWEQESVDGRERRDTRAFPGRVRLASWLSLAAAPTFAVMALATALQRDGSPDLLCSAAHGSPLAGMVPMYLLMSAFHLAPWLKLFGRRSPRFRHAPAASPMSTTTLPRVEPSVTAR